MDLDKKKLLHEYVIRVKKDKYDIEAWDFLYLGYRSYLLTIVHKVIFDSNSHQDILQEIWLKLYKHMDKYDGEREFENWLGKVATNVCYTWLGKNKVHTKVSERENSPDENVNMNVSYNDQYIEDAEDSNFTEDFANSICDRDFLENAFNEIKDKKQVLAFKLRFIEGLSIKDIARIMEVQESTLHNWIYRVKDKLVPILKKIY